jgi:hypothetical protein
MLQRRQLLGSIGIATVAGLAGCNSSETETPEEQVTGELDGLRWEMPCVESDSDIICDAENPTIEDSTQLSGSSDDTYNVTLRFRGVVEQMSYEGGTKDGFWYTGGRKNGDAYNTYRLDISSPEQHFFLNAGQSGIERCFEIDYTKTIRMDAGATVTLSADAQDNALISNRGEGGDPIIVEGVPPAPDAYNGQFIQMNVESVEII